MLKRNAGDLKTVSSWNFFLQSKKKYPGSSLCLASKAKQTLSRGLDPGFSLREPQDDSSSKQSGAVLFSVMVFILIISLIVSFSLENSFASLQVSRNAYQHLKTNSILNVTARLVKPEALAKCEVPAESTQWFRDRSLTWWQRHGCMRIIAGNKVYFVEQPLGSGYRQLIVYSKNSINFSTVDLGFKT